MYYCFFQKQIFEVFFYLRYSLKPQKMILLQKTIPVSPNKIWKALTKLKQMQKWYFKEITDFRPEVGFETSFAVVYRKKIFTHQWLIYDVLPQYRIAYYWQYLEYEGKATVSFDLEEVIQGTKVTLKLKNY